MKSYLMQEQLLTESFQTIADILNGTSSVSSIGMLTWDNPQNLQLSKTENVERAKELESKIKEFGLTFIPIQGKFNNVEDSYLILNPSVGEIISLIQEGDQHSGIYGDVSRAYKPVFKMILNNGSVDDIKYVWELRPDADDYYSVYKGVKFTIPFYESEFDNVKFNNDGSMSI